VKWTVVWTATAERDFGKLDPEGRRRIHVSINRYAADSVGDVRRLQDITPPEYQLRVGKWRVRFRLDHDRSTMLILHVLRRDEAY
jgi:mRNA-degrading endonuclease RelE of RelBE toxin-antitoxin system